ncbi:MAG: hypothetical protein WCA91_20970 [Candidatus Acidiferrales bacterium]
MQYAAESIHFATAEGEDAPMTYQVTMFGTDGIVMASDRCESWMEQGGRLSKTTNLVRKIFLSEKIAWTFSGGNLSAIAASYLRGEITGAEDASALKRQMIACGDRASANFPHPPTSADVLVAVHADYPHIIRAKISKGTTYMEVEGGKFVSGDSDNLASFFPEHYFSRDKPVSELVVLAAYAVFMAHRCNPRHIEDLDIAVWRKGDSEFKFLDGEKVQGGRTQYRHKAVGLLCRKQLPRVSGDVLREPISEELQRMAPRPPVRRPFAERTGRGAATP